MLKEIFVFCGGIFPWHYIKDWAYHFCSCNLVTIMLNWVQYWLIVIVYTVQCSVLAKLRHRLRSEYSGIIAACSWLSLVSCSLLYGILESKNKTFYIVLSQWVSLKLRCCFHTYNESLKYCSTLYLILNY